MPNQVPADFVFKPFRSRHAQHLHFRVDRLGEFDAVASFVRALELASHAKVVHL